MKIRILCVGRASQRFIVDGQAEYVKRLKPLARVDVLEILPKLSSALSAEEIRTREAKLILEKLDDRDYVIALDEHGRAVNSPDFAALLARLGTQGQSNLTFIIGGAGGLDQSVLSRSKTTLSLSPMTFTYQFARLILIEQLYRAFCINGGVPYHK